MRPSPVSSDVLLAGWMMFVGKLVILMVSVMENSKRLLNRVPDDLGFFFFLQKIELSKAEIAYSQIRAQFQMGYLV